MVPFAKMDQTQRYTLLLAILTNMLYEKGQETQEQKLLRELAIYRHTATHSGEFLECKEKNCLEVLSILNVVRKSEITVTSDALRLLKHYNLHCGSKIIGSVTAYLEEIPRVIL